MDKEKVKDYLWNYFFPITSASQEERRLVRGKLKKSFLVFAAKMQFNKTILPQWNQMHRKN